MPSLLSMQGVSLAFGGDPLLDGVSLDISKGDRIGLVGRNGSGKSSLLKVIAGELEPDSGTIVRQPALRIASLPQDVPDGLSGSVIDVVLSIGGDGVGRSAASSAISRLGLDPEAEFCSLSGGQRRRCLLARALASEPDILILDEPTNHLDIPTIEWLENYLLSRVPTYIFVTHDRSFLQHLAKRIVDLDRGDLNGWDCDYNTFLRRKQQVLEDEDAVFERMGKKLKKEEAWLRRGVKARTTRNEGRVRALIELRAQYAQRRIEIGTGKMEILSSEQSGVRAMRIKDVSFAYPNGEPLIKNFSLDILRGERIGIIGPNGVGKSTFVKLLLGELRPSQGEVIPGTNLSIVYFDQLRRQLNPELSVADNVADGHDTVSVGGSSRHILSYLGDFLFSPERARSPVKALSGGERSRLLLARLFLNRCNMLILDEPTNDLDVETLDLLEEQVASFDGTVIVISHDRTFLDNVVTSTIVFEDEEIRTYPGGYTDWRRAADARLAKAKEASNANKAQADAPKKRISDDKPRRLSYNEKREYESIPAKIEELEKEEAELNEKLLDPEVYKKPAVEIRGWQARLDAIPDEIDALMTRWSELEERA